MDDPSANKMETVIDGLVNQVENALGKDALRFDFGVKFDSVEVVAMGGSALAWDVLEDGLGHHVRVPVHVHRDYAPGSSISPNALGVAGSFSGNTEETLAAYEKLRSDCARCVVMANGGELMDIANRYNKEVDGRHKDVIVTIPSDGEHFQPRNAVGYFLTHAARILEAAGVASGMTSELTESLQTLQTIDVREIAKEAANWIYDGSAIPVIYTASRRERSVARTMKIKINENAKYPAFFGALPEINHNEMIGFLADVARFRILYLAGSDDSKGVRDRFSTMNDLFRKEDLDHIEMREFELPGDSQLERAFAGILFGDWCSYELAKLLDVDPIPVDLVEEFKEMLAGDG